MKRLITTLIFAFVHWVTFCQDAAITILVEDGPSKPLPNVTVELLRSDDSVLIKAQLTNISGVVNFDKLSQTNYLVRVSGVGYKVKYVNFQLSSINQHFVQGVNLESNFGQLSNITITSIKPLVELKPGKTIVNLQASITNTGTTVMEALEKMPGVTVDKDGNISLKGKYGVTVFLDGRPTYLSGSELSTLLNGMSAETISQVELMDQPPARYDAAGNAGVINIITKKISQKGFNGNVSTAFSQGRYPKNNNSLLLNYRNGKWNLSGTYSLNLNRSFTSIQALRTFFHPDGSIITQLDQPSMIKGEGHTHNLRISADYALTPKTSLGITMTGVKLKRKSISDNTAIWRSPGGVTDSLIQTNSNIKSKWQNGGMNFNLRHNFNTKRELTADFDIINYRIRGDQFFENNLVMPATYKETFRANIPNDIGILSAKVDYTEQFKNIKLESGLKTARITTDNMASYELKDGAEWKPDYGRSNHFLYTENIHAAYVSSESSWNNWTLQTGFRWEWTGYQANQLGNVVVKDSAFSRNYNNLFPTLFASFEADSNHTFSALAGRRIDRPAFQKLNPFLFIINKYTYQRGNPFYRPQYTWNFELSHSYKGKILTGLSYSRSTDYFSQVFPIDSNGIVFYTEGNLELLENFGISIGLQIMPVSWWNLSAQSVFNYKKMNGFIEEKLKADIRQLTLNINNQFRFKNGWSAELTGFYTSRSQHDIQEIVDPAGQLSVGVAKQIFKNKGTIKLAGRDLFYTQWMKGMTYFPMATEWFKLTRDTRVITISFSYRFGKAFKTTERSKGASSEEVQRVGNG